jgi:hypothetical protein
LAAARVAIDVRRWTELGPGGELGDRERAIRVVADDLERMQVRQQPERLACPFIEMNPALTQ